MARIPMADEEVEEGDVEDGFEWADRFDETWDDLADFDLDDDWETEDVELLGNLHT